MLPARVPRLIKGALPNLIWSIPSGGEKKIYLTFDDGPIPEVTPWVLDTLRKFGVKATFFCVGENAEKHPELFQRIITEGHSIGNHTQNHLNGWKTSDREYFKNVLKAGEILRTKLFRPPYGRLKPLQLKVLRRSYKVIMWSVLTQDYDAKITPEQCLENSLKSRGGDIVLFHDSLKAQKNLEYTLPRFLEYYVGQVFTFSIIS